jgi:hypothetical protein
MHSYQTRSGIDPVKWSSPGFYGQLRKNKKIFKVLIFHMKKLRKNPCEYMLYML